MASIFPIPDVAPVIISEPIITATEDQLYSYQVEASDPNGDTLTYFFTTKPEGMNIDSESGLITWTPTNAQVGIHRVEIEIYEGKQSATQSFEIEVFNVNNPPQILSYSPTNINIKINEGSSIKFEVQSNDIDLNTTLSFQWFLNGKLVSDSTVSGDGSKSSWIYSAGYGDYSQKIVKVLVNDGKLQDYMQWNITISDITPPAQPTLNTVTSPTNISSQTLSGTKEINTSVWINGEEVISVNSVIIWSYPFNLSEGINNISITSRDAAGNESSAVTAIIILDTGAPEAPTLDAVLSPTNVSPQILSGTKEINTSIWINNIEIIPINPSSTWTYDFNLSEGENNISITSQDSTGNESGEAIVKIILDTILPATPTLNEVITPTNISIQVLSGTKEADSSIWLNGKEVVSINSSTNWSYSYNLSEGTNNISITSRDAAGNESLSTTTNIILDTISPMVPTLNSIISPTNILTQILCGTKEAETSILINGVEVIPINSKTTWYYSLYLAEGTNSIFITSCDAAGNESSAVTAIIILDTGAPAVPTLDAVVFPTNISPQVLSGTKEVNTSIWINGVEVVSIDSSTKWSYPFTLIEGENNISITSCDAAGNESAAVNDSITLDTISPATPTLHNIVSPTNICTQLLSGNKEINSSIWANGVEVIHINSETVWSYDFELTEGENNLSIISKDSAGNESNEVNTIIILDTTAPAIPSLKTVASPTNISSQILSGTKEVNSSIWINGTEVISINSSTDWSYSFNLSEGTNNISITSRDAAGNESSARTAIIILDTGVPEAPTLDAVLSPTSVSPQTLSGTKEINTSIWINNIEIIPINSSTTWTYDFNLSEGENNISITSQDSAGNESGEATAKIILDTILPTIPTLNEVVTPTNISIQILSGSKEANSSIWLNGVEVVLLNSLTTWSYSFNLSEGTNNISITSRDAAGNESSPVTTTIEYDPNIYVDAANASGIEDGTQTHPFDTITEGTIAVVPGKSVMVAAGNYNEQLIINKGIILQGASRDNTSITGSGLTGNLITLEADYVTITGFTIDGASSTAKGIYFDSYSSININNNIIQNNISYGINYNNSSPTIENNDIKSNNYSGIDIGTGGAGIVRNNSIIFNKYGIRTCGDSSPEIIRNNISGNNTGIYCRESATPIISYNTISNNSGYGILIDNILGNLVDPDIGGGDGQSDGQNKITGNFIHGVSNKSTHNIYTKYNWWGDTTGPKYPGNPNNATILSDWAYWSKTGGDIIFTPHLTAAP